jgi:hypothetical protein
MSLTSLTSLLSPTAAPDAKGPPDAPALVKAFADLLKPTAAPAPAPVMPLMPKTTAPTLISNREKEVAVDAPAGVKEGQDQILGSDLKKSVESFLGTSLEENMVRFSDNPPQGLRRSTMAGFSGVGTVNGKSLSFAFIDPQVIKIFSGALGVDEGRLKDAVAGQEVIHKIQKTHPDFKGKLDGPQRETMAEAFSLKDPEYLPLHLYFAAETANGTPGNPNYANYAKLTGATFEETLKSNGVKDANGQEALVGYLKFLVSNMDDAPKGDTKLRMYLRDAYKVDDATAREIAGDLQKGLAEVYGKEAANIMEGARRKPGPVS